MSRPICIIEAPLSVGAGLAGVEKLPAALAEAGLAKAIGAERVVATLAPFAAREIEPASGLPEPAAVRAFLLQLADAVAAARAQGELPVVIGGDCTVLLGCLAGARRGGSQGLLFIDGHTDFNAPGFPDNETASMDLLLATGRGPAVLAKLDGPGPLVEDGQVVAFGFRDEAVIAAVNGTTPRGTDILCIGLADVRTIGFGNAVAAALARLTANGAPFWLHFDVDAIDDEIMPAVDYRLPDGLSIGEVVGLMRRALATGLVSGINVTILNPDLDWDGACARRVVQLLRASLAEPVDAATRQAAGFLSRR